MDSVNIRSLLEQYFEGNTSLEEENLLRQYFNGSDIEEDLKVYTPLFQFFQEAKSQTTRADFEDRLMAKIQNPPPSKAVVRRLHFSWIRVAAMIALVLGSLFLIREFMPEDKVVAESEKAIDWSKYEPKDPAEAYEKTMAALALVSNKMKSGEEKTRSGLAKIQEVSKSVSN